MIEGLMNHVSFDLRQILPPVADNITPEELTNNIHLSQFLEKADDINQLNLGNAGKLSEDLSYILHVDDNNLKGIGLASVAGIHTYNGNFKKAIIGLNKALELEVSAEVNAFIYTEYANLLRLLNRTDEAYAVFNRAYELTKNDNLKWRIHTYLGFTLKYKDSEKALMILNKSADYYLKNNNYARYATVLRHISLIYSYKSDFRKSEKYLTVVKKIAEEYGLSYISIAADNDLGWLNISQKNYNEAREIYNTLLKKELDPYSLSLAYQNLGVIEFDTENYKESCEFHKNSLSLTSKHEMYGMLYEDYYKIGLSYERLGNYSSASKYYKDGYEKLQSERKELGIILTTGYRKALIDSYMRFLDAKPVISSASQHKETFNFTEGKIYKEILDTFQENLLRIHRKRYKTIEQLCHSLDISHRLYFVYQNRFGLSRLEMKEIPEMNQHFRNYLFSLANLDWRTAKNQFDDDLYRFMLAKYGYNKTKIAEILDVSNLTVIKKTAELS